MAATDVPSSLGAQMVFDSGNTMRASEALRTLLHFRLRIAAALSALAALATTLRNATEPTLQGKLGLRIQVILFVAGLFSSVVSVVVWRRPNLSYARLRWLELLWIGTVVSTLVALNANWIDVGAASSLRLPEEVEGILRAKMWVVYSNGALTWDRGYKGIAPIFTANFGLAAVSYGILIPNTWRRCMAVMVLLIITAECCVLRAALVVPELRPQLPHFLWWIFCLVSLFAAVGVYGCYKLTVLRQEADEARKVGQYVLKERLGTGGMGEVYRARHDLLHRPCAVKIIRADRVTNPSILTRFEREVQAMAQLTHPNTVEIYDYGRANDGTLYYAMEYLPGLSLELLVRRHGPLPPGRTVYLLRQVCRALREAHEAGLVHRDIKPGNIFITQRGGEYDVVKLLDFGLVAYQGQVNEPAGPARTADSATPAQPHLTQDGHLLGTPAYMSPEQCVGAVVDACSDIYSVGAVAYFALIGKPPFDASTSAELCKAHVSAKPPSLTAARTSVPQDLEGVVLRCLQKLPDSRYNSAVELEAALAALSCCNSWNAERAESWWKNLSAAASAQSNTAGVPRSGDDTVDESAATAQTFDDPASHRGRS